MGHFRLNVLDSRGGGVFGGFYRGIVEIRGAKGLGKVREFEHPFHFTKRKGKRTEGLLGEALLWSHGACEGQIWKEMD